jgi:hypothetical protein
MPEIKTIKSMAVFYIDNRQAWPESAILLKNLVVWPDDGVYPSSTPVAIAGHPNFDGKILVQAGNRALVVTLIKGAQSQNDVREGLKHKPEQYRIAVDSIVHAIMLMRNERDDNDQSSVEGGGDVHAFTLLNMLKDRPEGDLLREALKDFLRTYNRSAELDKQLQTHPTDKYPLAEEMYQALEPTPKTVTDPETP